MVMQSQQLFHKVTIKAKGGIIILSGNEIINNHNPSKGKFSNVGMSIIIQDISTKDKIESYFSRSTKNIEQEITQKRISIERILYRYKYYGKQEIKLRNKSIIEIIKELLYYPEYFANK